MVLRIRDTSKERTILCQMYLDVDLDVAADPQHLL